MEKIIKTLEIKENDDGTYTLVCDLPSIPLEIAQTVINEVVKRSHARDTDMFTHTKEGEFVQHLIAQVAHYKFWNRFLYILCIVVAITFLILGGK